MLIATYLALMMVFGGGGSQYVVLPQDFKDVLKVEMPDKDQRKEVEKIADTIAKTVSGYALQQKDLLDQGRDLSRKYEVDEAAVERHLQEFIGNRAACQAQVLDLRFELVGKMTEEQWNALWAPRPDKDGS